MKGEILMRVNKAANTNKDMLTIFILFIGIIVLCFISGGIKITSNTASLRFVFSTNAPAYFPRHI